MRERNYEGCLEQAQKDRNAIDGSLLREVAKALLPQRVYEIYQAEYDAIDLAAHAEVDRILAKSEELL